jgi:L-lactate dehydrogenase complex protein LldG
VTTKAEFFARLRRQVARSSPVYSAAVAERPPRPAEAAEITRRQLAERWRETLERFREEFERVGGVFHRVAGLADVPEVVSRLARARRARRLISWHPAALGADWSAVLTGDGLTLEAMPLAAIADSSTRQALRSRIAEADLGITGADLAVAETGSLVLISGRGRPRSTSLLPACHVAVFGREALVESLAHVGLFLETWHSEARPDWAGGAINVITGPSRSADIELTLTSGVHGPKELHAIFVDGDPLATAGGHG